MLKVFNSLILSAIIFRWSHKEIFVEFFGISFLTFITNFWEVFKVVLLTFLKEILKSHLFTHKYKRSVTTILFIYFLLFMAQPNILKFFNVVNIVHYTLAYFPLLHIFLHLFTFLIIRRFWNKNFYYKYDWRRLFVSLKKKNQNIWRKKNLKFSK